jgi:hypothetical protein
MNRAPGVDADAVSANPCCPARLSIQRLTSGVTSKVRNPDPATAALIPSGVVCGCVAKVTVFSVHPVLTWSTSRKPGASTRLM